MDTSPQWRVYPIWNNAMRRGDLSGSHDVSSILAVLAVDLSCADEHEATLGGGTHKLSGARGYCKDWVPRQLSVCPLQQTPAYMVQAQS
jgi:hypothetical protein